MYGFWFRLCTGNQENLFLIGAWRRWTNYYYDPNLNESLKKVILIAYLGMH